MANPNEIKVEQFPEEGGFGVFRERVLDVHDAHDVNAIAKALPGGVPYSLFQISETEVLAVVGNTNQV